MNTPRHDTDMLLNAYVDGELDAASALAFDRRLATEPELEAAHDRMMRLRAMLRETIPRDVASDRLMQVVAQIGAPEVVASAPSWLHRIRRTRPPSGIAAPAWPMALAAALVGIVFGAGVTTLVLRPQPDAGMAEVVADHLRAVMAPQPFDVASSDQHTVKPWFTGRLPFAPRVFDLAPVGFPLVGGRVDVVGGQPAAALVFRHGKHLISLLSQPVVDAAPKAAASDRGFEVRDWTAGGLHYWAVSDVAAEELDAFVSAAKLQLARSD